MEYIISVAFISQFMVAWQKPEYMISIQKHLCKFKSYSPNNAKQIQLFDWEMDLIVVRIRNIADKLKLLLSLITIKVIIPIVSKCRFLFQRQGRISFVKRNLCYYWCQRWFKVYISSLELFEFIYWHHTTILKVGVPNCYFRISLITCCCWRRFIISRVSPYNLDTMMLKNDGILIRTTTPTQRNYPLLCVLIVWVRCYVIRFMYDLPDILPF